MTLTAPAPTLPLFATVDHEPALEFPVRFDDGEWAVDGDVPFSVEQRREAAWAAAAEPMCEVGRASVEAAPPEPERSSAVGGAVGEGALPGPADGSAVGSAATE